MQLGTLPELLDWTDHNPVWFGEGIATLCLWLWLWLTRPPAGEGEPRASRLRRHLLLLSLVFGQTLVVAMTGILAHMDTPWQQIAMGNLADNPALHLFWLVNTPVSLALGGTAYIYALTRLPDIARGLGRYFAVTAIGPVAFMPALEVDQLLSLYSGSNGTYVLAYWTMVALWTGSVGLLLWKILKQVADLLQLPQ